MKTEIVLMTFPGREVWLDQCIKSIGKRDVVVLSGYGHELDKIRWVCENTNIERFVLLQDSMIIKDQSFFELAMSNPKSVAFSNCPVKFGMYMGVFCRETLLKTHMPVVRDKEHGIELEVSWANEYSHYEPDAPLLFDKFHDHYANGTKQLHGRINLVLENDYIIKYKGTWR